METRPQCATCKSVLLSIRPFPWRSQVVRKGEMLKHAFGSGKSAGPTRPADAQTGESCKRPPNFLPSTREVDVVYTDMFLDTFNNEHDLTTLWNGLLDMNSPQRRERRALLVLSKPLYDTVGRYENASVILDGRCLVTTPSLFDGHVGNATDTSWPRFDLVVYFNVDPFEYARPGGQNTTTTTSPLADVVSTLFVSHFDTYMTSPGVADTTSVHLVYNTFLMRTDSVTEYERCRGVSVGFRPRVLPVHSYAQHIVCRTACNFCSDAVLCANRHMNVFTVQPGRPVPSAGTPGPVPTERIFRPDRLALLDLSEDRGGQAAAAEYHRFKQFYCTFAHGRDNKWGLKVSTEAPLRVHLQRWNTMLREELRRWYWVIGRETDGRSDASDARRKLMDMYAMCPSILNAVNVDRDVCSGHCTPPTTLGPTGPTNSTAETAAVSSRDYVRDVLMTTYDTSTFDTGGDLNDQQYLNSLLATDVSLNDVFVSKRHWPNLTLEHNRFLKIFQSR